MAMKHQMLSSRTAGTSGQLDGLQEFIVSMLAKAELAPMGCHPLERLSVNYGKKSKLSLTVWA